MFCPEPFLACPSVRSRNETSKCIGQRILGAIDLAIDIATLGEYGLEPLPADAGGLADGPCRERPGHQTGWEAFAKARRGDCSAGAAARKTESRPEAAL
jgi:hypothetical protein